MLILLRYVFMKVGIVTRLYGLDSRGVGVRLPAGARNFSLFHRNETGSGAQPASYLIGTSGFISGDNAAGA
jgi:hypothetical protein